jgi:hypothetical protein
VFTKLLIAWLLMAACVLVHAGGTTWILRWMRTRPLVSGRFLYLSSRFVLIAGAMIVLHLLEIMVWATFYLSVDAMPEMHAAFYFSTVTYTTTGYGDLVLPAPWRLLGGIEALTGILMCGWSTAFFFAVVSRLYETPAARA